jgi:hypothetical protein
MVPSLSASKVTTKNSYLGGLSKSTTNLGTSPLSPSVTDFSSFGIILTVGLSIVLFFVCVWLLALHTRGKLPAKREKIFGHHGKR